MRIFLLGFMGCGKSRIGSDLAPLMNFRFFDMDEIIERRAHATVQEIFTLHGEAYFRSLESEVLKEAAGTENVVVATGGGTPIQKVNLDLMQRSGLTVWLNTPFAISSARISGGERRARPLLGELKSDLQLYNQRVPIYREAALRVDIVGHESPVEVAQDIFERVSSPA